MLTTERRYDIDWIRVIAISLLLLYHLAIGFQSWGIMIGFIVNENSWKSLWIPMSMLNVWRIPLLFFASGMGVYFAIGSRNWKELLLERATRILVPFVFGIFTIVPIHTFIWQYCNEFILTYSPNPGHLWFLGNILVYVVILLPVLFYLKRNEEGKLVAWIKRMLGSPLGLLPVIAAFIAEAVLIKPNPYEMYAMTWHGFFLGMLAFFFGFCFVLSGPLFLKMLLKWRWLFLSAAIMLFIFRFFQFQMRVPSYQLAVESNCWILSVLAFGYRYLNHPSKVLRYLSQAAYPVYILHMIFLFLGSLFIFPLEIAVEIKFILLLMFTFLGCFLFYELIVRRISIVRPLFGLKVGGERIVDKEGSAAIKNLGP